MSRQLDQTLLSLLPTFDSDVPPKLVELASSLLAQSRHRASTLKADEEVARLYACAHIACDRLKISLDLPPIQARPPIPPRIYKKLYTHLDNILPNSSGTTPSGSRTRTPNSKFRDAADSPGTPTPRRTPSRATPTKEKSLAQFKSSTKTDKAKSSKRDDSLAVSSDTEMPRWIRPVTRFLCSETDQKKLAPSIFAGMEYIVAPAGRKAADPWIHENITSLLAAVYFFVVMRVQNLASGELVDRDAYVPQRKQIIALLVRARNEVTIENVDEDEAWTGWRVPKAREFDAAVAQVNEREWLTGDWYKAIADVIKQRQEEDVDMLDELEDGVAPQIQVRRADTMFQPKYDFLSDARRSDYAAWKEGVLAKISQALLAKGAMDIDT